MDIWELRTFFMWCSIINGSMFIVTSLTCILAGDFVYRTQSKFYPIPRDAFNVVLYSFMGLFKLIVIVFNVVPFIALAIMSS